MNSGLLTRNHIRLPNYDYSTAGYYFLTICTKDKKKLLCDIVGTGLPDGPKIRYTTKGSVAKKRLQIMSDFYDDVKIEKYVIMPNHIHMMIHILESNDIHSDHSPTNSKISKFVGTFKRLCNKEYGCNIWQSRSYDHIIRDEKDYLKIMNYIENNPEKWIEDRFFVE